MPTGVSAYQVGAAVAGDCLPVQWWFGGRVGWAEEKETGQAARTNNQVFWPLTAEGGVERERLRVKVPRAGKRGCTPQDLCV